MPDERDQPRARRQSDPADHFASKHEAFRSEAVQALVTNMLLVGGTPGDVQLLISLLRAALGRKVEAPTAIGLKAIGPALAAQTPNLVLVRDNPDLGMRGPDVVNHVRAMRYMGAVIVVQNYVSAQDAIALRRAGVLDVIETDDLNSVRLFEALLKAVEQPPTPEIPPIACLSM